MRILNLLLLSASLLFASKSNETNQFELYFDYSRNDWSMGGVFAKAVANNQRLGFGFYSRLGSKSFDYNIPEICQDLVGRDCRIQLSEYLWGFDFNYQYEIDLKMFKWQPQAGAMVLFSFNEGTGYKEKVWLPIPIGSKVYIPLLGDEQSFGINFGYFYWLNYRTRPAHHFNFGFVCQF